MKNPLIYLALMSLIGISTGALALDQDEIELEDFGVHYLYHCGDLVQFRKAVEKLDLDVDQPNQHGLSVVHLAAMHGRIDWIALLYSLDAALDEPDLRNQWTPIKWALSANCNGAIRQLQNFRANKETQNISAKSSHESYYYWW